MEQETQGVKVCGLLISNRFCGMIIMSETIRRL